MFDCTTWKVPFVFKAAAVCCSSNLFGMIIFLKAIVGKGCLVFFTDGTDDYVHASWAPCRRKAFNHPLINWQKLLFFPGNLLTSSYHSFLCWSDSLSSLLASMGNWHLSSTQPLQLSPPLCLFVRIPVGPSESSLLCLPSFAVWQLV